MTELLEIAQRIAEQALPGEQVEAYVARSRTTNIRAYKGEVEALTAAEPAGAGIRVVAGGRQGFAYAGTLDEAVLKQTLEDARDNATFGEPDEFFGLPSPDGVAPPDLELIDAALAGVSTSDKVELALQLERMVRERDSRVTGVRVASYSDSQGETAIATSTGIASTYGSGSCHASVSPLLEHDGDTQIGYGSVAARAPAGLDLGRAAAEGVDRAARLLGATKPASRRVTAVLDRDVASDFMMILGGTLSGEAVLKGRSLFANREGELVASPLVTLISDPTDPAGFGASRFDGEGLARRRVPLIEDGVLAGFLYNTYAGRRAGRASTAAAARSFMSTPGVGAPALTLLPGPDDLDALLAAVGDGIYVQEVNGLHSGVNPVSGDFSVGATGLVIRNGALAEGFREATIASTLQRMLLDVVAVGSDHEWLPGGPGAATLVIKDVSLGGS